MCVPRDHAHKTMISNVSTYDTILVDKIKKYMTVITSHTIPGLNEPTTTEHLRKDVVADFGNHKYFNLFSYNIGMKCDHGSHFVPLVYPDLVDAHPPRTAKSLLR